MQEQLSTRCRAWRASSPRRVTAAICRALNGTRPASGGSAIVFALLGLLLFVTPRRAAAESPATQRAKYDVRVAVDVVTRIVSVHAFVDVPDAWPRPTLWLYADRLREVPPSFDDFEAERIWPIGIERGGWSRLVVRVDGCASTELGPAFSAGGHAPSPLSSQLAVHGRDVPIAICKGAKRPLRVEIDGDLELPRRYGTLGFAAGTMTLGDPWYPLVLPSPDVELPPLADHAVRIAPTDARTVVTADGVFHNDEAHPVVTVEQTAVTHAPVVVLPNDQPVVHDRFAAVDLTFVTDTRERDVRHLFPVEGIEPAEQGDHWDVDAAGFMHGTVLDCIALLRRMGFVATARAEDAKVRGIVPSLVVVEVPDRQRLASVVPGMLLVSDHAFRLFPWNRTRGFHGRVIARHAFAALVAPHLHASSARSDAAWVPDLDGTLLAELLRAESGAAKGGAQKLISFAAFHPSIDQLLYSPRVAFGPALFGAIEEPDPDRPGADRARNQLPRGQFIAEKLRDVLGKKLARATAAHFYQGMEWRAAAQSVSDEDLGWFWKQWLAPHRKVAYRIAEVQLEEQHHLARVTVQRLGDTTVREPVVVEARDVDDHVQRATWDGAGSEATLTFRFPAKFSRAIVDPDGRLAQDASLADNHPRYDDDTVHDFRPPVFSQFGVSYAATEHRLDFDFDFALRRKFDIDSGVGIAGFRDARGYSGSVRLIESFGRMRDLNNRIGAFTVGAIYLRSPDGFGLQPMPSSTLSAFASFGYETRLQLQDPRSGEAGSVFIQPAFGRLDGGKAKATVTIGARFVHLFWEGVRNSTALLTAVGTVLGPALETQLLGIASRNEMRAFEADEQLARTRAYVIVEQRWKALSGFFYDVANATWAKAVELVPFGGIAVTSTRDSPVDFSGKGHVVGEIGLGLRLHHDYFGVQPGLFALDVALPIGRPDPCVRGADLIQAGIAPPSTDPGECVRKRQSVGVYLSAQQTF